MNEPKVRIMRQISGEQDKLLRVIDTLRFASVHDITVTDGQVRKMKVTISIDLMDPDSFRKTVEELGTIQL